MHQQKQHLNIKFIKIHPNAKIPKAAHEKGDAGFDLFAVEDITLLNGEVTIVTTGLQLADAPETYNTEYYLDVRSRSGLSRKLIFPVTGTVDVDYRGVVGVVLANLGKEPYHVKAGERIAQMVIQKIFANSSFTDVTFEETDQITSTERGDAGYGSSGR